MRSKDGSAKTVAWRNATRKVVSRKHKEPPEIFYYLCVSAASPGFVCAAIVALTLTQPELRTHKPARGDDEQQTQTRAPEITGRGVEELTKLRRGNV